MTPINEVSEKHTKRLLKFLMELEDFNHSSNLGFIYSIEGILYNNFNYYINSITNICESKSNSLLYLNVVKLLFKKLKIPFSKIPKLVEEVEKCDIDDRYQVVRQAFKSWI